MSEESNDMKAARDRLAAELATTKQALADALVAFDKAKDIYFKARVIYRSLHPGQCKIVSKGWACRCFLCQLDNFVADQKSTALATAAAAEPPVAATSPAPAKPAASDRSESDSVVDRLLAPSKERLEKVRELARSLGHWPTAIDYEAHKLVGKGGQCSCTMMGECVLHGDSQTCDRRCYAEQLRDRLALEREGFSPFAEKVEPAERRFACPKCGSTETIETGSTGGDVVRCNSCRYRCTWAEVEAAKGEGQIVVHAKTVDGKPLTYEQAQKLQSFINERHKAPHGVCPWCNEVYPLEGSSVREFAEAHLPNCKNHPMRVTEQQLAAANQAREAERQRAEAAEAAVGVMREALRKVEPVIAAGHDGNWPDKSTTLQLSLAIEAALATHPSRAANELRALRAFLAEIRAFDESDTDDEPMPKAVGRALENYDQAIAQGEQRGEGDAAWLIEMGGPFWLSVRSLGGWEFYWTDDANKAIRFHSQEMADAALMAIRRLLPDLFPSCIPSPIKPTSHVFLVKP